MPLVAHGIDFHAHFAVGLRRCDIFRSQSGLHFAGGGATVS